ncbi:MAG: hypothetical protein V5A16_01505 [Haloplanus sp.]
MPATTFLLVTVVTGLLVVGTGLVIARRRRHDSPSNRRPARWAAAAGATGGPDTATVAVVAAIVVAVVATSVVGPSAVVYGGLGAMVVGFFAWGVYTLGRSRGLPRAHSVGLSAWLFGVVLVGDVAVVLLVA